MKSFSLQSRFSFLILASFLCLIQVRAADESKPAEKSWDGIVKTGIAAVGGETTGTILVTKDSGTYELDFGSHKDLKKLAETLDGKSATVTGVYKPRPGVEIKERRIIEVKTLKGAG